MIQNSKPEIAESDVVVIARRYCGPSDSANGGYACGIVARRLQGVARVRLQRPPPLELPLILQAPDAGHVRLLSSTDVIADGISAEPEGEIPLPVDFDAAANASEQYRWFNGHPFPHCFVCGPERDHGDGLCIFPGPVAGREIVAAPWIPDTSVCDATGYVELEVLWAALDCPSWFGLLEFEPAATVGLLGELSAQIIRRPSANEKCVAIGWSSGRDGRKLYGGAALFASDGMLIGRSSATWIGPKL